MEAVIGWLCDDPGYLGGAELTMAEFKATAPDAVEFAQADEAETVVVGNCVGLEPDDVRALRGKKVIRYHHDLARHEHPTVRGWLERHATHIFTSPLHQREYGLNGVWPNIPPALDLKRLAPPEKAERAGAVAIASFQNPHKGAQRLEEWAAANGGLTAYGTGSFFPFSEHVDFCGSLDREEVADVLWAAKTFVHLPTAVEPFGRAVVEAWAAGCELVTNGLVGARHYIENDPEALGDAAERFWEVVL